jgi:hypothetical protein
MSLNKYALSIIAGIVALCAVGGAYVQNHALTLAALITVIAPAAVLAVVGKLTDVEALIGINPTISAILLGLVGVMPLVQTASADGVLTTAEIIGIVIAVLNQVYHSLTPPDAVGPMKFIRHRV